MKLGFDILQVVIYIIGKKEENMNTHVMEYMDQHTCKRCGERTSNELIRGRCKECGEQEDLMDQMNLMLDEMLKMVKNIPVLA